MAKFGICTIHGFFFLTHLLYTPFTQNVASDTVYIGTNTHDILKRRIDSPFCWVVPAWFSLFIIISYSGLQPLTLFLATDFFFSSVHVHVSNSFVRPILPRRYFGTFTAARAVFLSPFFRCAQAQSSLLLLLCWLLFLHVSSNISRYVFISLFPNFLMLSSHYAAQPEIGLQ